MFALTKRKWGHGLSLSHKADFPFCIVKGWGIYSNVTSDTNEYLLINFLAQKHTWVSLQKKTPSWKYTDLKVAVINYISVETKQ